MGMKSKSKFVKYVIAPLIVIYALYVVIRHRVAA